MIKRLLSLFNKLDWFVGGSCLMVGLYLMQPWLIAGGIVGLLSAYYQPAAYLSKRLEEKLLTKSAQTSQNEIALAEDAFYAQHSAGDALEQARAEEARSRAARAPTLVIANSPHNHLTPQAMTTFTAEDLALPEPVSVLRRSFY